VNAAVNAAVSATTWFKERAPRERLALTVGGVAVLILILYGWIWLPLAADTARLRVSVPPLRSQALQLTADAAEAKRLAAAPRLQAANDILATAVEQGVAAAGMKDRLQVLPLDASRVQLSADGIGFNEWINLLASLQQSRNARVESARVEPQPGSSLVRVQAVLSRPQAKNPS
jgi:general secretion pathway protein M